MSRRNGPGSEKAIEKNMSRNLQEINYLSQM